MLQPYLIVGHIDFLDHFAGLRLILLQQISSRPNCHFLLDTYFRKRKDVTLKRLGEVELFFIGGPSFRILGACFDSRHFALNALYCSISVTTDY